MSPELKAYRRLLDESPVRRLYEHDDAYDRRCRIRQLFADRIHFDMRTHCWTWSGSTVMYVVGGGQRRPYPVFYTRIGPSSANRTTQRSPFIWMMNEFFPEVKIVKGERTSMTCGNTLCISPYHRRKYMPQTGRNARKGKQMSVDRVLEIYALRGQMEANEAAAKLGIDASAVSRIWRGKRWASVTGHGRDLPQEQTPC